MAQGYSGQLDRSRSTLTGTRAAPSLNRVRGGKLIHYPETRSWPWPDRWAGPSAASRWRVRESISTTVTVISPGRPRRSVSGSKGRSVPCGRPVGKSGDSGRVRRGTSTERWLCSVGSATTPRTTTSSSIPDRRNVSRSSSITFARLANCSARRSRCEAVSRRSGRSACLRAGRRGLGPSGRNESSRRARRRAPGAGSGFSRRHARAAGRPRLRGIAGEHPRQGGHQARRDRRAGPCGREPGLGCTPPPRSDCDGRRDSTHRPGGLPGGRRGHSVQVLQRPPEYVGRRGCPRGEVPGLS